MSVKIRRFTTAAAYIVFCAPFPALAQTKPGAQSDAPPKPAATAGSTAKVAPEPPKKVKDDDTIDYEKFVKDLKRIDGPMVLYQKGKNIYLELPESQLDKVFLIQAAFDTGLDTFFMHAGMPIGGQAVDAFKFERKDDMVWLERPNIANRWSKDSTFAIGAQRSFPDAMLNTFRIEQHNVEKGLLLVNVTSLFYGDVFRLGEMISGGLNGPYQLDNARSEPVAVRGFPENTVVSMRLHYYAAHGSEPNPMMLIFGIGGNTLEDDRSAPVTITYSMWWRKDSDYIPRIADARIGYFTTDFYSVDKFLDEDKTQRYIDRFNLQKKDPKAAVSEPVKPIVFTIDPSIPAQYRPAVKEGVLRWNKAFEALGFKNAIQVQDVPKDDKEYDHTDGRYNVIRMLVGPDAPFAAISLLRTDPFTGEILNASITLDGNVLQELMAEHERILPITLTTGRARTQQILLRDQTRKMTDDKYLFETPLDEAIDAVKSRMDQFGWSNELCSFASEMAEESQMSWDALQAAPGGPTVSRDAYVNEYLSEAVCHEVGHCLGLRHNFAGSTYLTTQQLGDAKLTATKGTTASVMDYTPPNAPAVLEGKGSIFMPTVGSYDMWAIKYGYTKVDAKTPGEEKFPLSQIASQSGLPGHEYMTDEDADLYDPNGVRFDCSKDPLSFSEKQLEELHRARQYAVEDLPKPGESYSTRTKIILGSILRSFNEGRIAARFVGGTYGNRNFRGDTGERPTLAPVPASTQRQAMEVITNDFLAPGSFDLPRNIMESLSLDPEANSDSSWNAPLRELISGMDENLLALVMGASTTDRIAENSFKERGHSPYTLSEHYEHLMHAVFAELPGNDPITPLRRDLQRFFTQALITQAGAPEGGVNDDVRLVATDCLTRLDKEIGSRLSGSKKLDTMSRLHLGECRKTIERFLDRKEAVAR